MHRTAPRARWGARWARPVAALIAIVGVTTALGSSSGLETPVERLQVFAAPEASAAAVAGKPGAPPSARFDYRASRQFSTPDGIGYVLLSRNRRSLCVVLPDGALPGTFGSGCASVRDAQAQGLFGQMIRPTRDEQTGRTLAAFVLPVGATPDVQIIDPSGQARPATVHHGVAVATTDTGATLQYRVGSRTHRREIAAPFEESRDVMIACGTRMVRVTLPPPPKRPPPPGSAPRRIDTARYCR